MSEQITVIARIKAKPESADQLIEMMTNLVRQTRMEKGCLNYDFHRDLEDETLFFMYENWKSADALAEHFEQSYMKDAFARAPELLAEPLEIRRLKMLGDKA